MTPTTTTHVAGSLRFPSVWDALADTAEEAASFKVRAELIRRMAALTRDTDQRTASACRCSRSRRARLSAASGCSGRSQRR